MKIREKVGLFCLIATLFFNSNIHAQIPNQFVNNSIIFNEQKLMECMHKQVDLYQLNVGLLNNEELVYTSKKENGKDTKAGKLAKSELKDFLKRCPGGRKYIIEQLKKHEDVTAIGYIAVDLMENENGQVVPDFTNALNDLVSESGAVAHPLYTERGTQSKRGTCVLYTTVYKGAYNSSVKKYNFSTHSRVSWSEPKWWGGENYHGKGWDYILQSLPSSFVVTSDSIDTSWWYTDGVADKMWHSQTVANEEKYVSRNDGGNNFIRWAVKDEAKWDALGLLTAVADIDLVVTSKGPGSKQIRKINSWYVHTWESISLNVSVSASSAEETSLSISPSSESDSWKLYSYVNFTDSTFK